MQFRNTIRLTVAVAATGALATGVSMFHAGGDLQTAGNLVRASLVALALLVGSLTLEIGRAVDTLATNAEVQAARLQGYEDKIERDADHVRRLWVLWQVVAWLLILPTTFLVWYFHNSVTTFLFGTPDTRFIWSWGSFDIFLRSCALCAAIPPVRFGLLLLVAKAYPLGVERVASQQDTGLPVKGGGYIPLSRIAYFRLFSVLLTASLLANVAGAVSYLRVADGGIGVVGLLGTTEALHPWADVCSISEGHSAIRSSPAHGYAVKFTDGSEWKSPWFHDRSYGILEGDPRAAIEFAADRANLPLTDRKDHH